MKTPTEFVGVWRITQMDEWDQDYVDLVRTGFIQFELDGQGEFQFGTVSGGVESFFRIADGPQTLDWSWQGVSDTDPGCGRGWVRRVGDELVGEIFIHGGDHSRFTAKRMSPSRAHRRH